VQDYSGSERDLFWVSLGFVSIGPSPEPLCYDGVKDMLHGRRADSSSPSSFSSKANTMGVTRTVRVMLVEDHVAFREALAFLLSREPDFEVVAQAGSLAEAHEALDGRLDGRLDVAAVDLVLSDGEGSDLIGELRRRSPGVSVVVLSAAMGPGDLDEAVMAGSDAVLDKVESIPTIVEEVMHLGGG
jgi:CheY-like chemotaxis protein